MSVLSTLKRSCVGGLAALLIGLNGVASASIFGTQEFGVDFTIDATNGANSFTLRIENALSTTDSEWDNANYLGALGFKGLGINFQAAGVSASMSSVPAGTWGYLQGELDAKGCKDPGGQKGVICFSGAPPMAVSDDMFFTVTLVGALLDIDEEVGPHLKLQFLTDLEQDCKTHKGIQTCEYKNKEGSLLSRDIPGANGNGTPPPPPPPPPPPQEVPEPSSVALVGLGLLGAALARRRRRS